MTVDISKIKVGDTVTFGGKVTMTDSSPADAVAIRYGGKPSEWLWIPSACIVSHTPAPREFKAGDKVTWGNGLLVYEFVVRRDGDICLYEENVGLRVFFEKALHNFRHADEQQP